MSELTSLPTLRKPRQNEVPSINGQYAEYHGSMRHLKSSIVDLQRMFTQDLTVLHIAEQFQAIKAESPSSDAIELMHKHGFDVYGVEKDGGVIGFISKDALPGGTCAEICTAFQLQDVVSDTTPLLNIIQLLHERERLYILDSN